MHHKGKGRSNSKRSVLVENRKAIRISSATGVENKLPLGSIQLVECDREVTETLRLMYRYEHEEDKVKPRTKKILIGGRATAQYVRLRIELSNEDQRSHPLAVY